MWELVWIGILPNYQSRGYGHKLIEPILKMADAEGKKCVTWYFDPRNTNFFQRAKFEFDLKIPPSNGFPEWTIVVRKPQKSGSQFNLGVKQI